MKVYLDIARGDAAAHSKLVDQHHHVVSWLSAQHASYGLPATITELDEIQRETLQSLYEDNNVSVMRLSYRLNASPTDGRRDEPAPSTAWKDMLDRRAGLACDRQTRI
jgi:hypothetical protein